MNNCKTDIKIEQQLDTSFDVSIVDGDLACTRGFETAIWTSLLTDARASESQVIIPEYRRGWPGNMVSPVENRQLGSHLWLIDQRRLNQSTLNEAIDHARNALLWFIDDGLAKNVVVDGIIVPTCGIQLSIVITSYSGETETHYVKLWEITAQHSQPLQASLSLCAYTPSTPSTPAIPETAMVWDDSGEVLLWDDGGEMILWE